MPPAPTTSLSEKTIILPGEAPLTLVSIPAGSFLMGSPDAERSREDTEGPRRAVTVDAFLMGKYEITQAQWLAVMGTWPGEAPSGTDGLGNDYPAYFVSWRDAQRFVSALNAHIEATGQGPMTVRLPSEAEWEYACRGGTTTRFYFGDSLGVADVFEDDGIRTQHIWYRANNRPNGAKIVGQLLPNAFGLYDMHGNMYEWCEDDWFENYRGAPSHGGPRVNTPRGNKRVFRGGGWYASANYCRSTYRYGDSPERSDNRIGFRIAAN